MTARYHKYPTTQGRTTGPAAVYPQNELIGVANTLGRFLPQQSRMALNYAASVARVTAEAAESARIRGVIQRGPEGSGTPYGQDQFPSSTAADFERRLSALETSVHRKRMAEQENPQKPSSPDPSALLSMLLPLLGQNGDASGTNSFLSLMPFLLSSMDGQGVGSPPSPSSPGGDPLSALLPFLMQSMGNTFHAGNSAMTAMLPLLLQAFGGPRNK